MTLNYEIKAEICVSCGLCKSDCPSGAVVREKESYRIVRENCIECGHCGAICPHGAVRCNGEELIAHETRPLDGEAAFQLIAGKRSVRSYKTEPISNEVMERILEVGALTGTATNAMNVQAHVYRQEEAVRLTAGLCSALLRAVKLLDNPLGRGAARLAGFKRYARKETIKAFKKLLEDGTAGTGDPLFYKAPAVVCLSYPAKDKSFGRTNAVLAGQSMMLYAHSVGVESCMIGFAEMAGKLKRGRRAFGLGKDRAIGLIFTLGYGKPVYHRLPRRRPLG